jgi:mono/diheme cytochrome c family protein
MNGTRAIIAFLVIASVTDVSRAQVANVGRGEEIARRWCASCHVVAADQRQATSEAPPFATIARRPDLDANRLAFFLLEPHPKMPNMSLTRSEAADLAAYITSLAK